MVLLVMSVKLPPPRNLISCTLPPVMNEQNINITNPRSSGLHFCSTWRQVMWTSLSLDLCCIGLAAGYFYTILYFIKLHTLWKNPKEIWFQFKWRNCELIIILCECFPIHQIASAEPVGCPESTMARFLIGKHLWLVQFYKLHIPLMHTQALTRAQRWARTDWQFFKVQKEYINQHSLVKEIAS